MNQIDGLAKEFEANRPRLRAVAWRMLGSQSEAEDAVQEAWLRLSRTETDGVENLGGWLRTVVARVCLDMLRSRKLRGDDQARHEEAHVPDPLVTPEEAGDPEGNLLLADSVGVALQVVLETLAPAERLAFVLHDLFAMPFDEVADIVGRTPEATRQLASRGRRRVQGAAPPLDPLPRQREVVDAFFAAARGGDLQGLLAVLDPGARLRADGGAAHPLTASVHGAEGIARRAMFFARPAARLQPVLVNGAAGVVVLLDGRPTAVMGFSVVGGRIVAIDALADPARLERLELPPLAS